jgi:ech hydrogenase subunit A
MTFPMLLAALPPAFGILVLLIKDYRVRRVFVGSAAIIQGGLAVAFVASLAGRIPLRLELELPGLDYAVLGGELLLAAYFAVASVRKRRVLPLLLALVQAALAIYGERWTGNARAGSAILVDQLSLLMVLLVGVVGGLILFYATGYMQTYQEEHPTVRDRRRLFSFVMLTFLGAMYGLVLSNDLKLMLLFWEITTWASFILIGYGGDAESDRSAFRALTMNLLGGIAFAAGILLLAARAGTTEMDRLVELGRGGGGAVLAAAPVAFIALAGLVKSAQLPFTSWLLGAMVAPTPISALLHSSTMVKAGVFLLLRLAPALEGRVSGYLIAFVGILTFIAGAFAAVSRRNAKRILALSTVSNLGLIVTCAGIGTYQLVWVAFFLILFHAVAKALLFLAVGTVSVGTGSLDVEDMGGLIVGMPRITLLLVIGISAMFVAPFGMLVSKWAAMEAFINMNSLVSPLMIVLLAYGSATTVLFWSKWLGILIRMPDPNAPRGLLEDKVTKPEYLAEGLLGLLAVLVCVGFPLVSKYAVEPYLLQTYGKAFGLDRGNAFITVLMVVMIVAVPGLLLVITRHRRRSLSTAYMSGRPSGPGLTFLGSKGAVKQVATRSYYLEKFFDEERILRAGTWVGLLLVITTLGTVLL